MKRGLTLVELVVSVAVMTLVALGISLLLKGMKVGKQEREKTPFEWYGGTNSMNEFVYDGCQYVFFNLGNASWGSHKGSCTNPVHRASAGRTE